MLERIQNICANENILLYHGSTTMIRNINVSLGLDYKDFGKGFYTTDCLPTAREFSRNMYKRKSLIRASTAPTKHTMNIGVVSIYRTTNLLSGLNVKVFEFFTVEWLDFIVYNRTTPGRGHPYDIVIGPIADGDTILLVKEYMFGMYGNPADKKTKINLINKMMFINHGYQVYIGTDEAAKKLQLIGWRRV